jgi:hypothetical protein
VPHEDWRKRLNYTACDRMQKLGLDTYYGMMSENQNSGTRDVYYHATALQTCFQSNKHVTNRGTVGSSNSLCGSCPGYIIRATQQTNCHGHHLTVNRESRSSQLIVSSKHGRRWTSVPTTTTKQWLVDIEKNERRLGMCCSDFYNV